MVALLTESIYCLIRYIIIRENKAFPWLYFDLFPFQQAIRTFEVTLRDEAEAEAGVCSSFRDGCLELCAWQQLVDIQPAHAARKPVSNAPRPQALRVLEKRKNKMTKKSKIVSGR